MNRRPQRLTDFYPLNGKGDGQDGALAYPPQKPSSKKKASKKGNRSPNDESTSDKSYCPPNPSSRSLAKTKPKLDDSGLSLTSDSGEDTRDLPESIESFPMQNQPVLDTVLKDMLLLLRSTL